MLLYTFAFFATLVPSLPFLLSRTRLVLQTHLENVLAYNSITPTNFNIQSYKRHINTYTHKHLQNRNRYTYTSLASPSSHVNHLCCKFYHTKSGWNRAAGWLPNLPGEGSPAPPPSPHSPFTHFRQPWIVKIVAVSVLGRGCPKMNLFSTPSTRTVATTPSRNLSQSGKLFHLRARYPVKSWHNEWCPHRNVWIEIGRWAVGWVANRKEGAVAIANKIWG